MKCHVGSLLLLLLIMCTVSRGMIITGPARMYRNQMYSVIVTNFMFEKVHLSVTIESDSGFELTKTVDVRMNQNRPVEFHIPANLPNGKCKVVVNGQNKFAYAEEIDVELVRKSIAGVIQINKPVFKPGESVLFRVVILNPDLKPPTDVRTVQVTIASPDGLPVRVWSAARLRVGVFEEKLQIPVKPTTGTWNISVKANDDVVASNTFEVKEYVLSTFDVDVNPNVVPLLEHQSLDLRVTANYYFGNPVRGRAKLELFLDDDILEGKESLEVHGVGHAVLRFKSPFLAEETDRQVRLRVTFVEHVTNRTVLKEKDIMVYKYLYRAKLVKPHSQFRPDLDFPCEIHLHYHDGTPAQNVQVELIVEGLERRIEQHIKTDRKGIIRKTLYPTDDTDELELQVVVDGDPLLHEHIAKVDVVTDGYVKVRLATARIQLNKPIKLTITCSVKMTFLVYYVVSKGRIVDHGFLPVRKQKKISPQITALSSMMPESKLIVATVVNQTVVYDDLDIQFPDMLNNFVLYVQSRENSTKPGNETKLEVRAQPGSYVALAAYDESLLQHNTNHNLMMQNITQVLRNWYGTSVNDYDKLNTLGLFVRTVDSIRIQGAHSLRAGTGQGYDSSKLISFRTDFSESWLWQNFTMDASGRRVVSTYAPHRTTRWHLTGFAIHPQYGIGTVKVPVTFTTVKPFYIVENLPYSFKRGELVTLQFTLFNNDMNKQTATVKLYNTANQIEFVSSPECERSCAKSIEIPASSGVPVSFLVKAKKVGEADVRVEAVSLTHPEADGLSKVIHVLPENLVKKETQSRTFSHDTYKSASFELNLDINRHALADSVQIKCFVYPNLFVPLGQNLENLLDVPTDTGDGNMVHVVPNVLVLDYLTEVGSDNKQLLQKATELLRNGYYSQLKYRHGDGSFAIWQHDGGNVFLTASVANALHTASKYLNEVDKSTVVKAFEWLATKQNSTGHFTEVGSIIHNDLQGGISLTSYVLAAFLQDANARKTHASVIAKGVRCIEKHFDGISDLYDLSLATYALVLHDKTRPKELERLISKSTSSDGKQRYWQHHAHAVETTAYALLALVESGRALDGTEVMQWLVNERTFTGAFQRTQDTYVGLKALARLAATISTTRNEYQLEFINTKKNTKIEKFHISSDKKDRVYNADLPSDTRKVKVAVSGQGVGVFELRYEYAIDLVNSQKCFHLDVTQLQSSYELVLRVCARFIPLLAHTLSNMVLVEVNFPSGYVVDNDPITHATNVNRIRNVEIRYGATSVVVYYASMGTEENCFTITAYRRFTVALHRPAYVLVHDYFRPDCSTLVVYNVTQPEE